MTADEFVALVARMSPPWECPQCKADREEEICPECGHVAEIQPWDSVEAIEELITLARGIQEGK